jgi:oligoendopeptidase F
MKLTKAQVEAVVSEVNDRINRATQSQIHLFKGKDEWEKIKTTVKEYQNLEKSLEKAKEAVEKLESDYEDFESDVEARIQRFEKKFGVDVDWKWIEDNEEPTFKMEFKDLTQKIERTVTLLGIDSKEKITSDLLIEKMVDKFSTV